MRSRLRDPRLILAVSALMLGAAIAFPLGVLASHRFTDVPDSNTFHADIDAIADAGVTVGCSPTTYCPKEYVTREQMAAFLNRLGALGANKTPVVNAAKLAGVTSSQFLRSDVAHTGRETCIGAAMTPSYTLYASSTYAGGAQRYGSGAGTLVCAPRLPHGATITAFGGRIIDTTATAHLICQLDRYPKSDTFALPLQLARVVTTNAYTGGEIFRRDSSVIEPLVDNETYAYLIRCYISGGGAEVRIAHLDVEYTVAGIGLP